MDLPIPLGMLLRQTSLEIPPIDDMKEAINLACPLLFRHICNISKDLSIDKTNDLFDMVFNILCITHKFKYAITDSIYIFPNEHQIIICSIIDNIINTHVLDDFIIWKDVKTWQGSNFASLFFSGQGKELFEDCKKKLRAVSDDCVDIISPVVISF